MSWLSDHLFGVSKPKEAPTEGMASPTVENAVSSTGEIQSDTVTTSRNGTVTNTVSSDESGTQYEARDVAAEWHVPIRGKLHKIEFEHGTTSGRRILWIDEKVLTQFLLIIYLTKFQKSSNC